MHVHTCCSNVAKGCSDTSGVSQTKQDLELCTKISRTNKRAELFLSFIRNRQQLYKWEMAVFQNLFRNQPVLPQQLLSCTAPEEAVPQARLLHHSHVATKAVDQLK